MFASHWQSHCVGFWPCYAGKSDKKKTKPPEPSPLDRYIWKPCAQERSRRATARWVRMWSAAAPLLNLTAELRASHVNDVVTILVAESASAATTGATKTERTSSASSAINGLAGVTKSTGALANLVNLSGTTAAQWTGFHQPRHHFHAPL